MNGKEETKQHKDHNGRECEKKRKRECEEKRKRKCKFREGWQESSGAVLLGLGWDVSEWVSFR